MPIFLDNAPKYWEAGLQAIPLHPRSKRPIPNVWQQWTHNAITEGVKASWLNEYPDANVGVTPGPISNVCFFDLDIWDPELLAKVEELLPPSPWRRVGAKGCVLAYKWCDTPSFKINERETSLAERKRVNPNAKKIGVEFFGSSGQVVMPPSIHPDTDLAYVANCNLYDVIDQLQAIDAGALEKKIREVLKISGVRPEVRGVARVSDYVSKGTRDTTMVKLAGAFALDVRRGGMTLKEALEHMDVWGNEFVEDDANDRIDINKGKQRIIDFLVRDVHDRKLILPKGWDAGLDEETKIALDLGRITADDVSLDYAEITTQFMDRLKQISDEGKGQAEQLQAVDKALLNAARSKSISDLEIDSLFSTIQGQVGKEIIKMGALRRGLKKHQHVGIQGESHAEIAGQVVLDLTNMEIEVRYDHGILWEWQGSYWGKKDETEILQKITNDYGNLPAARRNSDHNGILKTVKTLVAKPIRTREGAGINFTNGYLGIDLRLTPHDREYGLTYELPYSYKSNMKKPEKFLQFLQESFPGDNDMIKLVQEALAVTLFGVAPRYQRCFLLYGVPHSGKSVMMDIVESLFPPEARSALAPNQWAEKYLTAQLDGPILNLAGELPESALINSQVFKQAVNGEPLTDQHKFQTPFTFRPRAAHWFASNHLPKSKDVSGGFLRRWMILPFMHAINENKRNVHLSDEIVVEEKEAIVSWAVEAIGRVTERNHLIMPNASSKLAEELGAVLNPIRTWFEEWLEIDSGSEITEEAAYINYQTFSLTKGYRKLDRGLFRATMRELGAAGGFECTNLENGSQIYKGIKLLKRGK